ncbi:helix-turn-helix transcriptional regulator [Hyphomicrobiales bacterium 4NK60-0047b]|jgi:transcriptional regulator with XRE-family HTH domain
MIDSSTYNIDRHVGEKLRERRILLGITQKHLASQNGVTFQQIQKYELGKNRISVGRLYRIAKILQVDMDYFFDGYEDTSISEICLETEKSSTSSIDLIDYKFLAAFSKVKDKKIQKALLAFLKSVSDD